MQKYFSKRLQGNPNTYEMLQVFSKKTLNNLSERDVTLIRASLSNEIEAELKAKGKQATAEQIQQHPAWRFFQKQEDGSYRIAIDNLNVETIQEQI